MSSDMTVMGAPAAIWILTDETGKRVEISRPMIAGREPDCDILLEEGRCSRKHASLEPVPEGVKVTDLGSSNGTFINGQRVESGLLRPGDELRFDTARYRVQDANASAAAVDATMLGSAPVTSAASVSKPDAAPKIAVAAPEEAKKDQGPAGESVKGAWWVPREEGPEGTLLMAPGAVAESAIEGTAVMAALGSAAPVMVGVSANIKGKTFNLQGDRWKIGRDPSECDIVLDDAGVSSFHAQVINEGATWKLINLMSSNGSFVNGQRVQTAYLSNGDRLQFGSSELVFSLGGVNVAMLSGKAVESSVTVTKKGMPVWVFAVVGFVAVVGAGAAYLLSR